MARRTRRTRIVSSSGNYGSSAVVPLATVSSASSISPASTPIPVASTNAVITVTQDSSGALTFEIFHPFGRLPLELRRKVWKATYPGRQHVALEPVCHSQADDDAKNAWKLENDAPFPVALFVHQESRTEILTHYTIIFRKDVASPAKLDGLRPICVGKSDLFWLNFMTIVNSAGELHDWHEGLKVAQPDFLAKVEKLEIRGTFTEKFFVRQFSLSNMKCLLAGDLRKLICGSFLLFPSLKEITFTGKKGDLSRDTDVGKIELENLRLWIVKLLESARTQFTGAGKVAPAVTFRRFKTFDEVLEE